ncbi:MAG: sterol desaturase family protein [Saprospiraceae bacterium]|nr:sterol desaturase family protein [Saprospiraceae bacterium]
MLIKISVVLAAVLAMEAVAWLAHRFIMHGFGWNWHEDHHKPHFEKEGFFEKNDLFFVVFAVPSATSFIIGSLFESYHLLIYVGLGILIYGIIYFLIHDVYIHRRFNWFKQLDNPYSRAVLRAHGAHHNKNTKEDCESFGLLFVHPRYFKTTRKSA